MTLKIRSTKFSDVIQNDKLEPRYHFFREKLQTAKTKFHFEKLEGLSEKIIAGKTHSNAVYESQNYTNFPFIRTGDVKKYHLNETNFRYLNKIQTEDLKTSQVMSGDLLISAIGNYLGSTCLVPDTISKATFNQNSLRVRLVDGRLTPHFLMYFLNSKFGQEQLDSLHSRTGQKIVNAKVAGELEVPLIKNESFTDRIKQLEKFEFDASGLIEKAQATLISELKIKTVLLTESRIFTTSKTFIEKESLWTPNYSRPKYREMSKYLEEKFPCLNLREVCSIESGNEIGSENYTGYLQAREDFLSFIRTTDIVNYQADPFPDFYVSPELADIYQQNLKPRDILFTNDGKIGQIAMVTNVDKILVQSHINIVRLIRTKYENWVLTPEYIFTCLSIPEIALFQAARYTVIQSTIPTLSSYFENFVIPLVPQSVIDEITQGVSQAFRLKEKKHQELLNVRSELETLFN